MESKINPGQVNQKSPQPRSPVGLVDLSQLNRNGEHII